MRRFLTLRGLPARAALALTAATAAATLSGCSSSATPDPYKIGALPAAATVTRAHAPGHWAKDGVTTLQLVGTLQPGGAAEFTAALDKDTTTVRATVTGGDLADGLTIARAIHDRKLNLIIDGPCAGPCADYWFPAAATRRTTGSGAWLGYVPDLSETTSANPQQQSAEAKLYTDSGLDAAKFHAALDAQLRETPGGSAAPGAKVWMPNTQDLKALGYTDQALKDMWLPPNLASANAQARAWGQVVAYRNTLVGLTPAATAPQTPASSVPAPPSEPKPAAPRPSASKR